MNTAIGIEYHRSPWLVINTDVYLYLTVSKVLQIIGQICDFEGGYLSLTHSFGVNP